MSYSSSDWNTLLDTIRLQAIKNCTPLSVTFELTPLCNFACKMCYVRLTPTQQKTRGSLLSTEQWLTIARKCRDIGVLHIVLTGGEVFSRNDFLFLYEELYKMGFLISILSNGYLINDEVIAVLKRRKPHKIRITLYGASERTYYNVCGVGDGFSRVKDNIQRLKANGINVHASMTVIKDNEQDLPLIKKWLSQQQIPFVYTTRVHKATRGENSIAEEVRLTSDSYILKKPLPKVAYSSHLIDYIKNPFYMCKCYRNAFAVTWDGRMIGCMSINSIYEDARAGDLLSNFRTLWDRLSKIRVPEKCRECRLFDICNLCPGFIASESGDPETISPYLCAMTYCRYDSIDEHCLTKAMLNKSMTCD